MYIHGHGIYRVKVVLLHIHGIMIHGISMDIPCTSIELDIHGISMVYGISTKYIHGISIMTRMDIHGISYDVYTWYTLYIHGYSRIFLAF